MIGRRHTDAGGGKAGVGVMRVEHLLITSFTFRRANPFFSPRIYFRSDSPVSLVVRRMLSKFHSVKIVYRSST